MKRQLLALGLASILTVPTWISLAHPMDASAKKVTASKKSKAVITKIKAIKANKATYIKTTTAAKKAYNKLSKADKKTVSNYKTLLKHTKATAAIITKANKVKKDAAAITNKNYKTTAPKVGQAYNALNSAGKAYLSASTVSKINAYVKLATANTTMSKLSISADSSTQMNSAQEILNFINAYEKLSANQKLVLSDYQEKIDYFLGYKTVVKKAVAYDAKYEKLAPTGTGYLKAAYDLLTAFNADKETSVEVVYPGKTPEIVTVAEMTENTQKIEAIEDDIAIEYAIKLAFEAAVAELPGISGQYDLVLEAVQLFKEANATSANGQKLLGKPIDIVDKKIIAEYKKYETIPSVVESLNSAIDYDSTNNFADSNAANLQLAGFTAADLVTIKTEGHVKKEKDITALDTAIKNYAKLGADQRAIVDEEIIAPNLGYVNDAAFIKKGQTVSNAYKAALAKNDLAAMMKQFDTYKELVRSENRAIRYVAASDEIGIAPKTYKTQLDHVKEFEKSMAIYAEIADIKQLKKDYAVIEKDKPSGVKMIDSKIAKDYALALTVLDIQTLMNKVGTPPAVPTTYTTKKLNYILSAVKLYNKLDQAKKDIIDKVDPRIEDYALDEKNIKAAMDIDKRYLELKKASKNYVRDANTVYNDYLNANNNVQKYIINKTALEKLENVVKDIKIDLETFEKNLNKAYEEVYTNDITDKVTVAKLKKLKNSYENDIKPVPKYNDLLDADVLKKYKSLAPIVGVYNQIFYLKPTPKTEIERENILTAIKAYKKLDTFGKAVVEIEEKLVVNLNVLDDEPAIVQAKKIDEAYKAIKVGDKNYEQKIYDVYKSYVQAHDDVKNYVLNKTVLNAAAAKYTNVIKAAEKFEKAFDEITVNSAIINIHQLKDIYLGNKKAYPALDQFIDPDKLKMYKKYLDLLELQDVAQIVYNQQLIDGDWVKYDAWFYAYGQIQDHKNDVQNMRKMLLAFRNFTPIQLAILNNSPSYDSYTGMKEDKNGNNIPIYDASGNIESYQNELNFNDKFAPKEVIYNPVEWLNYTQIEYVLTAIKLEERYNGLKKSGKTFVRDMMKLVDDYNNSPQPVQVYFLYSAELKDFENQYRKPLENAIAFENLVKDYNPNTDKLSGLTPLKKAYNALDSTALNIVDPTLLNKYKTYIDAENANFAFSKVNMALTTMINNANALDFISKYNKLTADSKKIVQNENPTKVNDIETLTKDEKDIKAAQTIDIKYEALDKSKDTYEVDVIKLYKAYLKLTTTAQNDYSVYGNDLKDFYEKYGPEQTYIDMADNPSATADEFTRIVTLLDSASPYSTVQEANELYLFLSVPQTYDSDTDKKVLGLTFVPASTITKYKKYEGLVTIANAFDKIRYPYEVTTYTVKEKNNILTAIAAYKKLARDPRNIFETDETSEDIFGLVDPIEPEDEKRYLVLVEEDIKIAAAADAAFQKIKKGDAAFAQNMIVAMKSYEGLSDLQKQFFTEQSIYKTYVNKYGIADSISGKVNTIPEAIKAVVDFEDAIRLANDLQEDKVQTGPSPTTSPVKTDEVLAAIEKADKYYKFINNEFIIEGQKIRLTKLANSSLVTDYNTLMKLYKVGVKVN